MANLQNALGLIQQSGIDLSKNANPFGMLAMAQQMQTMGGAQNRSRSELMNVVRGETPPDPYMSYTDALGELNKRYKTNPEGFNDNELMEIKKYATMAGKNFDINFSGKRAVKRAGLNFLDMLAFGLVPDETIDKHAPALNDWEKVAGGFGSAAGFMIPYGAMGKVAQGGLRGVEAIAKGGAGATKLGRGLGIAGKTVGGTKGARMGISAGRGIESGSQSVAKWVTANEKRKNMLEQALRVGSASAITSLYDEGVGGAIANGLGGMTLGAIGKGLSGFNMKPKLMAGAIYAGLSAPDQEATSEEHIEHVLKVLIFSGFLNKGGKGKGKIDSNTPLTGPVFTQIKNSLPASQRRALLTEGKGIALRPAPLGLPAQYGSQGAAMPMGGVMPLQGTIPMPGRGMNWGNTAGEQLSFLNLLSGAR